MLGFYVRLPRLAGRGFSDAKRIIPFRIMNCRFILRRILTAIRGLCRRRQQDSRKGCRLPAFRGVIAISMGYVAKPGTPPFAPIFSLKNHRSENFRVARMTRPVLPAGYVSPRGLPVYFVRVPQVAPWRLQTRPAPYIRLIHVIFRRNSTTIFGSHRRRRPECRSRYRLSPSPAGFEFSRGSDASPRKPPPAPLFSPQNTRRPVHFRAGGMSTIGFQRILPRSIPRAQVAPKRNLSRMSRLPYLHIGNLIISRLFIGRFGHRDRRDTAL